MIHGIAISKQTIGEMFMGLIPASADMRRQFEFMIRQAEFLAIRLASKIEITEEKENAIFHCYFSDGSKADIQIPYVADCGYRNEYHDITAFILNYSKGAPSSVIKSHPHGRIYKDFDAGGLKIL